MPCKVQDIANIMEAWAPLPLAEEWDAPGLGVGSLSWPVHQILVALEVTSAVFDECLSTGADMLICHHPVWHKGIMALNPDHHQMKVALAAYENKIAVYSAHTNFDAAKGGINDLLASRLGLLDTKPAEGCPMARIGHLKFPMTAKDFATYVAKALNTSVRAAGDGIIKSVCVLGGSGADYLSYAVQNKAQAFVTGDSKHRHAREAEDLRLVLIDAGHFETEIFFTDGVVKHLQNELFKLQYKDIVVTASTVERTPYWIQRSV